VKRVSSEEAARRMEICSGTYVGALKGNQANTPLHNLLLDSLVKGRRLSLLTPSTPPESLLYPYPQHTPEYPT
jgi:hypothetical protein